MTTPALIPFAGPVALANLNARLPAIFLADARSSESFWEFFAANIRNRNSRRAYYKAACRFNDWCEGRGLFDLGAVKPLHVAAYIEDMQRTHSKLTVKQHLAALRMLFDWLVVGHIMDVILAHALRGPKHVVKKSKTPVLTADEARILLDSIDTSTVMGLRDRALIALRAYSFARFSAATAMKVEDYFVKGRRSWVRLYEKGGKLHEVPAHHNLDDVSGNGHHRVS
jgi:integrase/recombinase XerD